MRAYNVDEIDGRFREDEVSNMKTVTNLTFHDIVDGLHTQKRLRVIDIADINDCKYLTPTDLNNFLKEPEKAKFLRKINFAIMRKIKPNCDFVNYAFNLEHVKLNGLGGKIDYLLKVAEASKNLQYFGSHDGLHFNLDFARFIREKAKTLREIFLPNYICADQDVMNIARCQHLQHLSIDCRCQFHQHFTSDFF